ncbi:MAG: hypothetical protein O2854_07265 [Chloroflexi bacterium]|nr:hypothetical protein [Chloroflexota bacterium]
MFRVARLALPLPLLVALTAAAACSGDPAEEATATAVPEPTYETQRVLAPIESAEIVVGESNPPQYFVQLTSGLPSGCARFDENTIERDGKTLTITVWNTEPAPGEEIACTAIYGFLDHNIALGSDFQPGETYTVRVNDKTLRLVAQGGTIPIEPTATPQITLQRVLAPIEGVSISVAESFPEQYFLAVTVGLPNGCVEFDNFEVSRQAQLVFVTVWNLEPSQPVPCTQQYRTQVVNVPLGSDFERGGKVYSVMVNDKQVDLVTAGGTSSGGTGSTVVESEGEVGVSKEMRIGDAVTFGTNGAKIQFLEVSEDSRCPSDVVCVQAGSATILIGISGAGQFPSLFELSLDSGNEASASTFFGGFKITLEVLDPYPVSTVQTAEADYVVTLLVTAQ